MLDSAECRDLMRRFIAEKPELWYVFLVFIPLTPPPPQKKKTTYCSLLEMLGLPFSFFFVGCRSWNAADLLELYLLLVLLFLGARMPCFDWELGQYDP